MKDRVERVHDELKELLNNKPPKTQCPLFNSMALTINSQVHKNALMHLCTTHPVLICPIALIVLENFKRQHVSVTMGKELKYKEASENDIKWETTILTEIKQMDLTVAPDYVVGQSIHDMLCSQVHIDAMFQVCRRFRAARSYVRMQLNTYKQSFTIA